MLEYLFGVRGLGDWIPQQLKSEVRTARYRYVIDPSNPCTVLRTRRLHPDKFTFSSRVRSLLVVYSGGHKMTLAILQNREVYEMCNSSSGSICYRRTKYQPLLRSNGITLKTPEQTYLIPFA